MRGEGEVADTSSSGVGPDPSGNEHQRGYDEESDDGVENRCFQA